MSLLSQGSRDIRVVRVFVSSTFRDMQAERHALVTDVFPDLRARLRMRGVELFEVDLRWGITDDQVRRGETLGLLLREIDRCRPFFLGMLGDRYGFIPPEDDLTPELKASFPSIAKAAGRSVTEIEILHGALGKGADPSTTFFLLRDPAWIQSVPAEQRGDYLVEDALAQAKLADLKQRIQASGARVRAYSGPAAFAEALRAELWTVLDEQCPAAPEGLFEEAQRLHEVYGRDRVGVLVGATGNFERLNEWADDPKSPTMLISGEGGSGKTATIANWLHSRRELKPNDVFFEHYVGAASDSADPASILRRLWEHLNRATGESIALPSARAGLTELSEEFQTRLAAASSRASQLGVGIFIAIDGLEKLEGDGSLRWLPQLAPNRVKFLVSATDGEPLRLLRAGRNLEIRLEPLPTQARYALANNVLSGWGRALASDHLGSITSVAMAGNPLFLRTMLEELRASATHDQLSDRIAYYGQASDMTELFERVLSRLEGETTDSDAFAVALGAIWASRNGLEEADIITLSGLSPVTWAKIRNGLAMSMQDRDGRIAFDSAYLLRAVMSRYFSTREKREKIRLSLANHFLAMGPVRRAALEVPRQLRGAGDLKRLNQVLTDAKWHQAILALGEAELFRCWLWLEGEGVNVEQTLVETFDGWLMNLATWSLDQLIFADAFAEFLTYISATSTRYLEIIERVAREYEHAFGKKDAETLRALNRLASVSASLNIAGSEELQRGLISIEEIVFPKDDPRTLTSKHLLAEMLAARGNLVEARQIHERVFQARLASLGADHLETLRSLSSLARINSLEGNFAAAMADQEHVVRSLTRLIGPTHPDSMVAFTDYSTMVRQSGDLAKAEALQRRVLDNSLETVGERHFSSLKAAGELGSTLCLRGQFDEAERLQLTVINFLMDRLGTDHPAVLRSALNLAATLDGRGKFADAGSYIRRVVAIRTRDLGPDHRDTLLARKHYAVHLHASGERAASISEYERLLPAMSRALGANDRDTRLAARDLAHLKTQGQ